MYGGSRGTSPSLDLTFPPTGLSANLGGMERGRGGKGEMEWWGDHLPYFPPLASVSNTTMEIGRFPISYFTVVKWESELTVVTLICLDVRKYFFFTITVINVKKL